MRTWFDVAMNDAERMNVAQPLHDLPNNRGHFIVVEVLLFLLLALDVRL